MIGEARATTDRWLERLGCTRAFRLSGLRDHPKPTALRPNFLPFPPARIWLSAPRDSGHDRHAAQLRADLDAG
jgi:hypothetical protein